MDYLINILPYRRLPQEFISPASAAYFLSRGSCTGTLVYVYRAGSMFGVIGLISVISSCSTRYRFKRSSYVTRLMPSPKWPNRPLRPMRCKYVSEFFGKSKLITTFTDSMSIPRVNKSEETKQRHAPLRKSWNTRLRWDWYMRAWM